MIYNIIYYSTLRRRNKLQISRVHLDLILNLALANPSLLAKYLTDRDEFYQRFTEDAKFSFELNE